MTATMTPLPPAPSRGDDSATFSDKADALLGALQQFVAEANVLITGADLDSATATAAAIVASNQATAATSAAATAIANTNIPRWVSGTTYAADAQVVSPAMNTVYRRRAAGAGTTDPSVDLANWAAVNTVTHAVTNRTATNTLTAADRGAVISCQGTFTCNLPASSVVGNGWFVFITNNGNGVVTVTANGAETIGFNNGSASLSLMIGQTAMIISDSANPRAFRFVSSTADKIVDIPSAAILDVRHAGGDIIHVTGTTYVGTLQINAGQTKVLVSVSGFTLGSGTIMTPYNSDLTVPAGHSVTVIGDYSNVPRVVSASNLQRPYLNFRDVKSPNTAGGANTAGENIRTLNEATFNSMASSSLAANVITLPAGAYTFRATAPVNGNVGLHRLYLYNNTDAAAIAYGSAVTTASGGAVDSVEGRFVFGSSKAVTLRHRITTAVATNGLGLPINDGGPEVYATIQIWKEA